MEGRVMSLAGWKRFNLRYFWDGEEGGGGCVVCCEGFSKKKNFLFKVTRHERYGRFLSRVDYHEYRIRRITSDFYTNPLYVQQWHGNEDASSIQAKILLVALGPRLSWIVGLYAIISLWSLVEALLLLMNYAWLYNKCCHYQKTLRFPFFIPVS